VHYVPCVPARGQVTIAVVADCAQSIVSGAEQSRKGAHGGLAVGGFRTVGRA
jgi:hypothetical protein